MEIIPAVFKNMCPNCESDISADKLFTGKTCEKCTIYKENFPEAIKLRKLSFFHRMQENLSEWEKHFKEFTGFNPWSLQKNWAKRVFLERCFGLLAPTGVGKTTFGLSMATFLKGKSYIIVPTRILVTQVYERIKNFGENILPVTGKKEEKERIKRGEFKILISTSMFLYKNYEIIPKDFEFIFVDDVDSFLKTARNIDKLLFIMGFDEEDIKFVMEFIKETGRGGNTQEIAKIKDRILKIQKKRKGILVLSSATSNPKTQRIKLFRELLNFEVGRPQIYLRNVFDSYIEESNESEVLRLIKKFGKGGLLFVSQDKGKEEVKRMVKFLRESGVSAISYEDLDEETIEKFKRGEIEILVGISSYRNPLARGIDLPSAIRYAIFYGVPKLQIPLDINSNPKHLMMALASLRPFISRKIKIYLPKIDRWIKILRKVKIEKINEKLIQEIIDFLKKPEITEAIKNSNEISFDGKILTIADITGYIQASGRTSRLFAGGISFGLSVILVDNKRAFNNLIRKGRWFGDIEFKKLDFEKIEEILKRIDEDRKKIKKILEYKISEEAKDILKPILIIVESPNKARTIANFFGKPVRRKILNHDVYEIPIGKYYITITSSFGHILDLTTENVGLYGVLKNGEFIPVYEILEGKREIVESIKNIAVENETVLIATDPDTEGEKIGWDLYGIIRIFSKEIKRMEFHEVTKKAILEAIENTRDFETSLVKAQILRRISDRWIGFEFSQFIQKRFKNNTLSVGRVQTPVLGWIIERYRESKKKKYLVSIYINKNEKFIKIDWEFERYGEAKDFANRVEFLEFEKISEEKIEVTPPPPYRTDTFLKEVAEKLKYPLPKAMQIAQDLFEMGFITYHRTDSTRVSQTGINIAKEYISERFSEKYFQARLWGEGGAHECIRPTRNLDPDELRGLIFAGEITGLKKEHVDVYHLVFERFIASQMKSIKVKISKLKIRALEKEKEMNITTEILQDGFNLILHYPVYFDPDKKMKIHSKKLRILPYKFPFTHAEIVQEMKQRGIGRPSTYAITIEKLLERKYVVDRKGFLIPTKLGINVFYTMNHSKGRKFVSEEFTRILESYMDMVEENKRDYQTILKNLYDSLK